MSTLEPVIVPINRNRCTLVGLGMGLMGFLSLSVGTLPAFATDRDHWLLTLTMIIGFGCLATAAFYFGLARRQPVVLRMDEGGISGYYVDPARWDEIARVFTFVSDTKHQHKFLGFELRDPVAFRDRQTPWRRYLSASRGKKIGAHLVVPDIVLKDTNVEALALQARAFLSARSD